MEFSDQVVELFRYRCRSDLMPGLPDNENGHEYEYGKQEARNVPFFQTLNRTQDVSVLYV